MIRGNSMSLYKVVLIDQSVFFLSAFSQRQAECLAANFTSIPIAFVLQHD